LCEAQTFGREAHGERVHTLEIRDRIRIVRDGRPVFDSALRWSGPVGGALDRAALLAGGRFAATVVLAAADAERHLEPARTLLDAGRVRGCDAAASCWNGLLVVRMLSRDGIAHRRLMFLLLELLRAEPLPRMWQS
jgi:urease accessory protein